MWRALLQDVELMPQHQDFGFKPSSRLETVAQHADEKEGNSEHPANIQQTCSDSPAIANQMDGVFGTDRQLWRPLALIALAGLVLGDSLFSCDVALRAFAGYRLFAMAAPTGGTILIAAWLAIAVANIVALVRN
jgi:hypothetical protein